MTKKISEHDIQSLILLELSKRGYYTERVNVGEGYLLPTDFHKTLLLALKNNKYLHDRLSKLKYFKSGVLKGRSDISAHKKGESIWIEVKSETGKISKEQLNFIEQLKNRYGLKAGVARSVEEAIKLIEGEL